MKNGHFRLAFLDFRFFYAIGFGALEASGIGMAGAVEDLEDGFVGAQVKLSVHMDPSTHDAMLICYAMLRCYAVMLC